MTENERILPGSMLFGGARTGFYMLPVARVEIVPPGQHPESCIVDSYYLVRCYSSEPGMPPRSRGFMRTWIGADLQVHVIINPRDEVARKWEIP